MNASNFVNIVEVGPRDGLQNEPRIWPVAERVELINQLSGCGFQEIEVGSFVSEKWVPQMADTDKVFCSIAQKPEIFYSTLVPNVQGLQQAMACGVKSISVFTAASETFNLKNINCSIEESFHRMKEVTAMAKLAGMRIRGYISCVIECPYEGRVSLEQVLSVTRRLYALGCDEISLGDTIGSAYPDDILELLKIVSQELPVSALAIHCHDTFGRALDNINVALDFGIRTVDSAIFGLGGCPYAGGKAKGNVATEKVVEALMTSAYQTSVDLEELKRIIYGRPFLESPFKNVI